MGERAWAGEGGGGVWAGSCECGVAWRRTRRADGRKKDGRQGDGGCRGGVGEVLQEWWRLLPAGRHPSG